MCRFLRIHTCACTYPFFIMIHVVSSETCFRWHIKAQKDFPSEIDKNWKLFEWQNRAAIVLTLDQKLTMLFSQTGTVNSISERYNLITDTVFEVCSEFLKPTKRKHSYWFDFEDTNIDQLLKQRTCQRQAFLKSRTKDSEFQYKQSKLRVRKYLRNMENAFWKKQCEQLQVYANRGDTHKLYKQIKQSHGPQQSRRLSQSFLKKDGSTSSSIDEALERLQEYYSELLNHTLKILINIDS